ncbi:3'-5' exonuclease [Isoalcanivorax indicus]|uniref:3'-5' exonuclease n=1 Tax=Isoalcanivorax indicus TaxID=2202653 RepID=UPI000DBAA7E6|nr:3'-5' exonuclease [Isoalcanivorax indicus]
MLRTLRRVADRRRHGEGDYAHLFQPYHGSDVIALDCETTSADARQAELVSIAAVPVRHGRVLTSEALDLTLRRPHGLQRDSIRIHGLRPDDLVDGCTLDDALERLLDFIGNRPIVGWCIDFDLAVINRHLRPRAGFELPNRSIELTRLYQRRLRRSQPDLAPHVGFEAMARSLDVPVIGRHTALGDATTAALMYLRLMKPEPAAA